MYVLDQTLPIILYTLLVGVVYNYNTHVDLAGMMSTGRPHEVEGNGNIIALSALFI